MNAETENEFKEVYKKILSLEERQKRILDILRTVHQRGVE